MTIHVTENDDGSFTIDWDENDPAESLLNDWTNEDFVKVIMDAAEHSLSASQFAGNYPGPLYARHPDLVREEEERAKEEGEEGEQ